MISLGGGLRTASNRVQSFSGIETPGAVLGATGVCTAPQHKRRRLRLDVKIDFEEMAERTIDESSTVGQKNV